ncbi:MAG: type II toxin-antitoxin system VapC family toxin [Betaproteobacteria bacterium]|nr:MAG: type II toxin-antitoxin system VapC family toxin [Betaproteobacteria bacterium]TMH42754.1 MAG: type II toxin-antitoxin system VapC family toxin [Betaproteobacteria bacterium]
MIVLDTNVVSELMKGEPDEAVSRWIAGQPAASLYTTSITQAEILYGIQRLSGGKRRSALQAAADAMFNEDLAGRVLAFGSEAARAYANIVASRMGAGRPMSQFDAQIAAIVLVERATLATRNLSDYEGCGVKLIDPWND